MRYRYSMRWIRKIGGQERKEEDEEIFLRHDCNKARVIVRLAVAPFDDEKQKSSV